MPRFVCKARNWDNKEIVQVLDVESKKAAAARLRGHGYFVTSIKEKRKDLVLFQRKITPQEIAVFARQFATMIGAGVPLVRCLSILFEQEENPRLKEIITCIREDVEGGATFSNALQKHPDVFSDLFVNLVKAGETGGVLDEILERLATYLESSEQLRQKVKGALTYPVIVVAIAFAVVVFLVTFVLPTFQSILGDFAKLPLPTRMLMITSSLMKRYFLILFLGLILSGFSVKRFLKTKVGIRFKDTHSLRVPKLGKMLRKVAVAKFTRTLGTLIASGVPILQALEVTADTAGNVVVADAVRITRAGIREGESIAGPLRKSKVFPPMVVQMIAVGEETGELDTMLTKIADFYDSEVDHAVKALTSIIEPVVIVFMGIVIGGIVMAIFLPLVQSMPGANG